MNNFCTDSGFQSLNKFEEILCGDTVEIVESEHGEVIAVLTDGLGSGVKASILSTITAKIIATMMSASMDLEDCVSAVAATLPVCEVRRIAYSTFTIIRIVNNSEAEIIQYDNPRVIFLRDGVYTDMHETSVVIDGKTIYKSRVRLRENDTFIAVSDGVIHAGVGKTLNFGWQRDDLIKYVEGVYSPTYTAKSLATIVLGVCNDLYGGEPGDDTTVCAIRIRKRAPVNLLIGPPSNSDDVQRMMSLFFSKEGKHIICGGTTSGLASEFLNKPVKADIRYLDPEIPPTAEIEGVDLVTEGVITFSRVLFYSKDYLKDNRHYQDWSVKRDGASMIARMLFEEATDINFFVGRAVNPAHQNPDLPIGFSIKMRLVEELSDALKQMGKRIKVSYF
ncbi:MAG: serine/threonine-protein phosphatase [Defluviitaleaceae bacterium]|nr:serine/threonine-protein phosphatase [Defluviitaleaceae bacterium]